MNVVVEQACFEKLEVLIDFIKDIAIKNNFNEAETLDIVLATEEILVNIISYAYPKLKGEIKIECDYIPNSNQLIIIFTDDGIKFDVMGVDEPDIDTPLEDRKIGGMGVFLVRNVMDNVHYIRKNKQNILTISKFNS
ncbi:MAG TPA: ATP-binding protein [Victivallales bacterium]|nr:ATP-binding protein [Victivallales bacterium]